GAKQTGSNYMLSWGMPGVFSNQPYSHTESEQMAPSAGFKNEFISAYSQYSQSNKAYSDASYVRLKNIALTYRFTEIFNSKLSGHITVSGQNVLTITNYKGLDPETLNQRMLPPLKTWSFGILLNL